jgi:hypothetical protein
MFLLGPSPNNPNIKRIKVNKQKNKTRILYLTIILTLLFPCPSLLWAVKYQQVYLEPDNINKSIGSTFTMSVMYDVTDNNNTLSGIGIRMHYDSSKLTYINYANIAPFYVSSPMDKAEDPTKTDRDSNTDRMIIIAWADTHHGNFPGQELPYKLLDIIFQVKSGMSSGSTAINTGITSAAAGYYGDSRGATVNITTMPTISWTAASQSVTENAGTIQLAAQLSYVSTEMDITVPITVSGTADLLTDYTISGQSIFIPSGEQSAAVTISLIDDLLIETNETIVLTLGNADNVLTDSPDTHILTIENNDQGHFTAPINPTYNSVQFYGDNFIINGAPANIGDEIGVFDPDGVLCGRIIIEHRGIYVLTVYGDNASTQKDEGAVENDVLTFKVWDLSYNFEKTVSAHMFIPQEMFDSIPACENIPPLWTANTDRWGLNLHITNGQEIPLKKGWNFFSFAVNKVYYDSATPPSVETLSNTTYEKVDSLNDVFASINGKYDLVRNYNSNDTQTFDPNIPSFFNTLHYLAAGYGYWMKMKEAATLKLSGPLANPSDSIMLHDGWNLIGCWSNDAFYDSKLPPTVHLPNQVNLVKIPELKDVLQTIDGKYSIVRSIDTNGSEVIYDVNVPSFLNSLHFIGPGYGYWIKMNEPAIFCYPSFSSNEKYQQIFLTPGDINKSIGATFTLSVMYHVSDGNRNLPGVGIRIHYDSSILSYINCTNIAPQNVSTPIEKNEEPMSSDRDPETDRMLIMAWADSNGEEFPELGLPYKLSDITFQVKTDFMSGSTSINTGFTSVASGYSGVSENAVVHISTTPENNAAHFNFSVPSTTSTMNIYGDFFTIDNEISEIGDEIAVFDQQGIMCGHYMITHPGYFKLTVYGDDTYSSTDEGATIYEDLVFKVWDASTCTEIILDSSMIIQKDVFDKPAIDNVPPKFEVNTRGMGIAVTSTSIKKTGNWNSFEDKPSEFLFQVLDIESYSSDLSITVKPLCPDLISSLSYTQNTRQSLQTFSIVPLENQYGTCPIAITVTDHQSTLSESFMISICAVDDPPEISPIPDQKITDDILISEIDFHVDDIDSDPNNIQIRVNASNPIIVPEGNIFIDGENKTRHLRIYPTTNEMGNVWITITAVSNKLTDSTTFTLAFNTPPDAQDSPIKLDEDESLYIPLNANDAQNDPLTYTIVELPKHGSLIHNNGNNIVYYTPFPDYNGMDIFSFKASDGYSDSNIAQIVLTIKPINDPPVAPDLIFQTSENTACPLYFPYSDVDGDILTHTIHLPSKHGSLSQDLIYTPDQWFRETDSLIYSLSDGEFTSNTATVKILVNRADEYTLSVTCPKGVGEIEIDGRRILLPWEDVFVPDTELTIKAISSADWIFSQWEYDQTISTDNPLVMTMDKGKTISALFLPPTRILKVLGYQSVKINDTLYDLPLEKTFYQGDVLNLLAVPQNLFKGWSGDILSDQNPIDINIQSNVTIGALFENSKEWTLPIQIETVDLPETYTDNITIGVSLFSETQPYQSPKEYWCRMCIYSEDSRKYSQLIQAYQVSEYHWTIGVDPHGNIGNLDARTSRLYWHTSQLSDIGYYRLYRGFGQNMEPVIEDMRAQTSYEVTGEETFHKFTIVWSSLQMETAKLETQMGWNLVSLPVNPLDASASLLFPDTLIYAYENGAYVRPEILEPGKGYWIKAITDAYELTGEPMGSYTSTLNPGWHIVGGFDQPVDQTFDSDCYTVVFGYQNGAYVVVSEFVKGRGYWVKMKKVCEMRGLETTP